MYRKTISWLHTAAASYGVSNNRTVAKVIDPKMGLVRTARKLWPKYATIQEDSKLRNKDWDQNYKDKRIVMWDNTGIRLHKPTDALLQRMTYSSYYAGNVGKGGIFVQLCGWMGTHELYPGAMSDSDYLNKTGILEEQKAFQEKDGGIPFTNILDKGYRSTRASWRNGQFVLQPTFAKCDKKFTTNEVLRSASIAADRSANERAVRVAKMSSYVKRGTEDHRMVVRLCDAWLAWSWQVNFMFLPVL
jgi:hypothetical protein